MSNLSNKKSILLHSCCGPCSTAVIERLLPDFDVTVFYFNPNITDPEEYSHRKAEQIRYINELNASLGADCAAVNYMDGDYNPDSYFEAVKGFENEPEGGARCAICFKQRLLETAKKAKELGFDCFDTTLTVSPYKNYDVISSIASEISEAVGVEYVSGNYKKADGYKRSIELSKAHNLYRQHFCGCEFSKR